jgi:Mg-chelatase subunit ChlI
MISQYSAETALISEEIIRAREILKKVEIPGEVAKQGIALVQSLQVDSLRAEITLFEAARACAAADGRVQVNPNDLRTVSAMCLRLRHSHFMDQYLTHIDSDEDQFNSYLNKIVPEA